MNQLKQNILFASFLFICLVWFTDNLFNDNSLSRALPIYSKLKTGFWYFDDFQHLTGDKSIVNNHYFSDKAPFPTLLVYPFAFILNKLGFLNNSDEVNLQLILVLGGLICSTIPLTLLFTKLFAQLKSYYSNSYFLVTLPILGSMIFVYSNSFYSHILAGVLLVYSKIYLDKSNYFWAVLLAGFAFLSEYPSLIVGGIFFLQSIFKKRELKLLKNGIPAAMIILFIFFYHNYSITGSWFSLSYDYVNPDYAAMKTNYGFSWPNFSHFIDLNFSLYRGIFVYNPSLILLVLLGLIQIFKNNSNQFFAFLMHPFLPQLILLEIVISGYFMWWGGWSYGPRHLMVALIPAFYFGIPLVTKPLHFFCLIGLSIIGLTMSFLAKSTVMYGFPSGILNPFIEWVLPKLNEGVLNLNQLVINFLDLSFKNSILLFFLFYFLGFILLNLKQLRLKNVPKN